MSKYLGLCILLAAFLSGCGINQSGQLFPWFVMSNDASQTVTYNGDRFATEQGPLQATDKHSRVDSRRLYGIRDDDPWDMR